MSAHRPNQRWTDLKYKFRLTKQQYEAMADRQMQVCAICGQRPDRPTVSPYRSGSNSLCVDHDHSCCPGRVTCGSCVRGLLCNDCNWLLGSIEGDLKKLTTRLSVDWTVSALRYIGKARPS